MNKSIRDKKRALAHASCMSVRWLHGRRAFWRRGGPHLNLQWCWSVRVPGSDVRAFQRVPRLRRYVRGRRIWERAWGPKRGDL